MAYVVTENCINCKFTDCVEVCPVNCFYEGPNFLVINPDECIDCSLCVSECPVGAIVAEDELTKDQKKFKKINSDFSKNWPNIISKKKPYKEAEYWKNIDNKIQFLKKK